MATTPRLGYRCDGASYNAALIEELYGHGLQLKLGGAVSTTWKILSSGTGHAQNQPYTLNGFTANTLGTGRFAYFDSSIPSLYLAQSLMSTTSAAILHALDGGGSGTAGAYDETNDLDSYFTFQSPAATTYWDPDFGFHTSGTVPNSGSVRVILSADNAYVKIKATVSAAIALVPATKYYARLYYVAADNKAYLDIWTGSYNGTLVGSVNVARGANTWDVNRFGWQGGAGGGNYAITFYDAQCLQADFSCYDSTSPTAALAQLTPGTGTLNTATAQIPILKNGAALAESDTGVKIAYSTDSEASYSAWLTIDGFQAVGNIAVVEANGIYPKVQFNSDGLNSYAILDGTLGVWTPPSGGRRSRARYTNV